MRPLAVALGLALLALGAEAAEPPTVALDRGILKLSRLPPVLGDENVAPQLRTGLTTVFLFTLESRGALQQKGAAQAAVRYDLWDEVYHLELSPALAGNQPVSFATVAAPGGSNATLLDWWRSAVLRVAPADGPWQAPFGRVKLTLQVLPFSQAEQRDAQEWLLRSLRAGAPPAPVSDAPRARAGAERAPAPAPVRDFYGAMLASSIGRRSLTSWSWTVPVTVEAR
jgi:hypothetical protein